MTVQSDRCLHGQTNVLQCSTFERPMLDSSTHESAVFLLKKLHSTVGTRMSQPLLYLGACKSAESQEVGLRLRSAVVAALIWLVRVWLFSVLRCALENCLCTFSGKNTRETRVRRSPHRSNALYAVCTHTRFRWQTQTAV